MNRLMTAAFLTLLACKSENSAPQAVEPTGAPSPKAEAKPAEPSKPSGTQVADSPIQVDLPANAVANDPLGAPGFHSEDGSISAMIAKQPADAPTDMNAEKKAIEEVLFKKWIKTEKTPDGWVLTWNAVGMDMSGNEIETSVFEVVKKIGEDTWRCSGGVKKKADLEANLKLCNSLRAN